MSGWISIHRQLKDNWVWQEKPFSKGQAWIDILLMVNHKDNKILLGSELKEVKRGSRITSIRKLCTRWGWSNTKVKAFLKLLEEDEMLVVKSDTKKTVLTVVNYNDYQDINKGKNDAKATQKRHKNDAKATQKHTNNNDNNENNDNSVKTSKDKFDESSIEYRLSKMLYEGILENDPKYKKPNLNMWAEHIDKLIRLDNRGVDEIKEVINFVVEDEFWKTNVLSTSKLRKQFSQLSIKLNQIKNKNKTQNNKWDVDAT